MFRLNRYGATSGLLLGAGILLAVAGGTASPALNRVPLASVEAAEAPVVAANLCFGDPISTVPTKHGPHVDPYGYAGNLGSHVNPCGHERKHGLHLDPFGYAMNHGPSIDPLGYVTGHGPEIDPFGHAAHHGSISILTAS